LERSPEFRESIKAKPDDNLKKDVLKAADQLNEALAAAFDAEIPVRVWVDEGDGAVVNIAFVTSIEIP
jgi:hypothetical protein